MGLPDLDDRMSQGFAQVLGRVASLETASGRTGAAVADLADRTKPLLAKDPSLQEAGLETVEHMVGHLAKSLHGDHRPQQPGVLSLIGMLESLRNDVRSNRVISRSKKQSMGRVMNTLAQELSLLMMRLRKAVEGLRDLMRLKEESSQSLQEKFQRLWLEVHKPHTKATVEPNRKQGITWKTVDEVARPGEQTFRHSWGKVTLPDLSGEMFESDDIKTAGRAKQMEDPGAAQNETVMSVLHSHDDHLQQLLQIVTAVTEKQSSSSQLLDETRSKTAELESKLNNDRDSHQKLKDTVAQMMEKARAVTESIQVMVSKLLLRSATLQVATKKDWTGTA